MLETAKNASFLYACKRFSPPGQIRRYDIHYVNVVTYITAGTYEYTQGDRCVAATPGTLIFVPEHAVFSVTTPSQSENMSIRFLSSVPSPPELVFYSGFHKKEMENAFRCAVNSYLSRDDTSFFKCQIQLNKIFLLLAESRQDYCPQHKLDRIQPAITYMREHLRDPEFSVAEMLKRVDISGAYFNKLFTAAYHMPPQQYVITERIELAKDILMHEPDTPIREVAEAVGYPDPFYFSRLFKKYADESPSQFARRYVSAELGGELLPGEEKVLRPVGR